MVTVCTCKPCALDKAEKKQSRLISASRGHSGAKCWSCLGLSMSVCTLDSSVSTRNERRGHDCHRVEMHRCCVCWSPGPVKSPLRAGLIDQP